MRCLLRYVFTFIEVLYFLSLMSVSFAYGNVGEKCPFVILFRMCMATNAYCDSNNICQCKSDYPVKVDSHTCRKPRRYGERCSVTAECSYLDKNSYCTQLSYRSVCECHEGFRHDADHDNCAKVEKARSSAPNLVLPMAVGLSLALACLICCSLGSVHFCRVRRRRHNCRSGSRRAGGSSSFRHSNNSEEARQGLRTQLPSAPSMPEEMGSLPPYDLAVTFQPIKEPETTDEFPPSYDEVMKNC